MSTTEIRREIDSFQHAVKSLSDGINQSGATWNDAQFKALSELIRSVASSSREVIVSGGRACEVLDKFEQIAAEE